MLHIPLRGKNGIGKSIMIDDADLDLVCRYKWHCVIHDGKYPRKSQYAKTMVRIGDEQQSVYIHRLIMGLAKGNKSVVDHLDGNGLNCTRSNMRICSNQQNALNRGLNRNNTSGARGIWWCNRLQSWFATIRAGGRIILNKRCQTMDQAIAERDRAMADCGIYTRNAVSSIAG